VDPPRTKPKAPAPAPGGLSADQIARVRRTLERIDESPAFRNSKQCQKLLRYVVEHSLAGDEEFLHERSIGIEVFGRAPDYDTAGDPVVRVRATEVRKRLSQYYWDSAQPEDARFEIPSGCYRVEIHWPAATPETATPAPPAPRRRPWMAVAAAVVIIGSAVGVALWRQPGRPTQLDQFWAPVMASPKPVLLYCGQPVVYFLSRSVHDKYRQTLTPEQRRGSYVLTLPPGEKLSGSDVIPVTDQFVGIGNAHTAALLTALFAVRHKPVELRYANDLSFSDLRSSPSVLIGAFSNFWTLEMTGKLRFVFEQDQGVRRIRDRVENRSWQLANIAQDGKTPYDYAVVSRLFDSETGQLLIAAAGITQYGTRAAGEFLTDSSVLSQALAKAPPDWPGKNLQVLLHTTVYKGTPAPPRVLAAHFW
jgi:hypothetical protein